MSDGRSRTLLARLTLAMGAALLQSDYQKYAKVVKISGARIE